MATRNTLFDLIASMNKTEKRYFKLQSTLHTRTASHAYVHLFDAIESMHCYDDNTFDNALRTTGSSTETQKYLYEALLRSLHLYHRDQSVETTVRTLLHQADLLYRRKLYGQAKQLLTRAKHLAEKHERYVDLLDVLKFEYRLILAGHSEPEALETHISGLFEDMKRCLAAEESSVVYGELNAKMFYYTHTPVSTPRTQQHVDVYDEIMQTEAMRDYSKALSAQAKIMYWNNLALYREQQRDYRGKLECYLRLLELLDSGTVPEKIACRFYRVALHNICSAACSIHKYDVFFSYYDKLLASLEKSPARSGYMYSISAMALLVRVYVVQGRFDEAVEELLKIEAVLEPAGEVRQGTRCYLLYLGIHAYFGTGSYAQALARLDALLCDRTNEATSPDLYYTARLLEILVHYELGHTSLVASLVRSTAKFLRSRDHLHKAEAAVLRFFRTTSRRNADVATALDRFHNDLLPLLNDRLEIPLLALFNFLCWTESKRTGRSYAEVVRDEEI